MFRNGHSLSLASIKKTATRKNLLNRTFVYIFPPENHKFRYPQPKLKKCKGKAAIETFTDQPAGYRSHKMKLHLSDGVKLWQLLVMPGPCVSKFPKHMRVGLLYLVLYL